MYRSSFLSCELPRISGPPAHLINEGACHLADGKPAELAPRDRILASQCELSGLPLAQPQVRVPCTVQVSQALIFFHWVGARRSKCRTRASSASLDCYIVLRVERLSRTRFRSYLPLMPLAIEQLDLSAYDLVISSNHAVAKGVITGPGQLHLSYVHSPMRYAWDLQHQYLAEAGLTRGLKSALARLALHYLRQWDVRSANGVDGFIANSHFIARRIRKVYRREASVIHPPVDVARFPLRTDKQDFYLTASRMVPYKKVPLIVQAFARMPEKRLVVIGDGPEFGKAKAAAEFNGTNAANITLLGHAPGEVLVDHMQRAKAFVFAAEEDFGITPLEAQACGTPVIAFGRGGSLETVRGEGEPGSRTGVFFGEQTVESIVAAVRVFEAEPKAFTPAACRANAERFSQEVFRVAFGANVERAWGEFERGRQRLDAEVRA